MTDAQKKLREAVRGAAGLFNQGIVLEKCAAELDRILGYSELSGAMRALESLAPGGSEYVGDVDRCVSAIKDARQAEHDALLRFAERAKTAEAQRDELVGALRAVMSLASPDYPKEGQWFPNFDGIAFSRGSSIWEKVESALRRVKE